MKRNFLNLFGPQSSFSLSFVKGTIAAFVLCNFVDCFLLSPLFLRLEFVDLFSFCFKFGASVDFFALCFRFNFCFYLDLAVSSDSGENSFSFLICSFWILLCVKLAYFKGFLLYFFEYVLRIQLFFFSLEIFLGRKTKLKLVILG